MLRFEMINLATILLSLVLPAAGCEQSPSQTASKSTARKETTANSTAQKEKKEQPAGRREATAQTDESNKRVAIPEIAGCTRDNTTFYSGEVRAFKNVENALEITVFTDWNTTATLVQPENSPRIIFRRDEEELTGEQVKKLEADLAGHESEYRATVWVCLEGNRKTIKVIEFSDAEGASGLPGSAPRRQ